jgi:signal transduction histidine kinase
MTIRKKAILAIIVTFFCIILITWFSSRFILLNSLNQIEENNARNNIEKVLNIYSDTVANLESITSDWASWDESYYFVKNNNIKFVETNITEITFKNLKLNLIVFYDLSNKVVLSKAFDLNTNKEIPLPSSIIFQISECFSMLRTTDSNKQISGLLVLEDTPPLFISIKPIVDNKNQNPSAGTLVFGRFLNTEYIDQIDDFLSLTISIYHTDDGSLPDEIKRISHSLTTDTPIITKTVNSSYTTGYCLLNDMYNHPVLILKADMPLDIYRQGRIGITYVVIVITSICIIAATIAVWFAEKEGLSRLKNLAHTVKNIAGSGKVSGRILLTGKDEVSSLATNINLMLASLQHSEEILQERAESLQTAVIEAQIANQAKTEFLSSVSHELRTPLTAIIGLSQLLQKKYYGTLNVKQTEYVNDILESSNHLLNLINDILDLAKIESGKSKLELENVKIHDLISSSLLLVKENAVQKRIAILSEIPVEILNNKIIVDKRRFRQIMVNLLSNAIKFTDKGGKVIITAIYRQDSFEVNVTDTGIGIKAEEQQKIFDAFYQVYGGTKGKSPGTGLGLSLAKRLVEQHNGRIWVESEGVGKGSRFSFTVSQLISDT